MASIEIAEMMKSLRGERTHIQQNLKKLDKAITVLRGLSGANSTSAHNGKTRTLSIAARRKIAKAQRLRWAKVRQQRASKS
jgi:hypothetical protein